VKPCRVSFRDTQGVEHAARVQAINRYHAFGLAMHQMRRCQWSHPDYRGVQKMTVEILDEPTVRKKIQVTRDEFESWMSVEKSSEPEKRMKKHLRMLLGREEPDRDFKRGLTAR
jgi:hypothetical protein